MGEESSSLQLIPEPLPQVSAVLADDVERGNVKEVNALRETLARTVKVKQLDGNSSDPDGFAEGDGDPLQSKNKTLRRWWIALGTLLCIILVATVVAVFVAGSDSSKDGSPAGGVNDGADRINSVSPSSAPIPSPQPSSLFFFTPNR